MLGLSANCSTVMLYAPRQNRWLRLLYVRRTPTTLVLLRSRIESIQLFFQNQYFSANILINVLVPNESRCLCIDNRKHLRYLLWFRKNTIKTKLRVIIFSITFLWILSLTSYESWAALLIDSFKNNFIIVCSILQINHYSEIS